MTKVIRGSFALLATYSAQEPGGGDKPDIKRPPDKDVPEFERNEPDPAQTDEPGAPPFTGEDVEDIPKRDLPVM